LNCAGGFQSIRAKIFEVVEPALPEAGHLARPVGNANPAKSLGFGVPAARPKVKSLSEASHPIGHFSGFSNSRRRCSTSLLY
jgi:hypothetical protein